MFFSLDWKNLLKGTLKSHSVVMQWQRNFLAKSFSFFSTWFSPFHVQSGLLCVLSECLHCCHFIHTHSSLCFSFIPSFTIVSIPAVCLKQLPMCCFLLGLPLVCSFSRFAKGVCTSYLQLIQLEICWIFSSCRQKVLRKSDLTCFQIL